MANKSDVFPLADAIASLRAQVRDAAKRAAALPEEERFRITEATVELTVVAEDSIDGGTEVGWWVFKAKAGISAKDAVTHKICLKLDLGPVEVGSQKKTA